jgi:hypothetical protein
VQVEAGAFASSETSTYLDATDPQSCTLSCALSRTLCCALCCTLSRREGTALVPEVAPFPAGLNDCFSGLQWLHRHRERLRISARVCAAGESGGGNLCLALALKAKAEGALWLMDSGVFSMCPYIAGRWPAEVWGQPDRGQETGILGDRYIYLYTTLTPLYYLYSTLILPLYYPYSTFIVPLYYPYSKFIVPV